MFRKSFGFLLLIGLVSSAAFGQKTSDDKKTTESKAFTFTFGGGSFLGVRTEDVNKENFAKFGLRDVRGVAVTKVEDDSPAAKAGIVANDVIIRIDGDEVTSVRKLQRIIGEIAPDHTARITLLRNGQEMEVSAVLEARKFDKFNGSFTFPDVTIPEVPRVPEMPKVMTVPPGGWTMKGDGQTMFFGASRQIGVSVSSLTKQLGEYFDVPEGKGLLVTSVRENSPAAKAGIRAGDVIVQADGKDVANTMDLLRALGEKKEGAVTLTVVRDKSRRTISVTPETAKEVFAPFIEGSNLSRPVAPIAPAAPVTVFDMNR